MKKDFSVFSKRATEKSSVELITPLAMKLKAKNLENKGVDIIHLEIGEPDFDTPENISQKGIEAIKKGYTHYTSSQGMEELRNVIASYISKTRQIDVSPDEVIVTPGGKDIIFFTMMALLEEGDEVIIQNPGYYTYEADAKLFGAKVVPLPLLEENNFSFDRTLFKKLITPKTKLIALITPANPTGNVFSKEDLEFIAEQAIKNNIYVLSDEIYSRIVYEGEFFSIASIPGMKERTILLDGFSKTYAMTGWRLGYGVANIDLIKIFNKFMVDSNSCVSAFTQIAGIEALTGPQDSVEKMRVEYEKRRNYIVDALNNIDGISCNMPQGAFYAFPNIKSFGMSSNEFALKLLEAGVATIPGNTFGKYGEGYLRISYANSLENLEKAIKRIKTAINSL